MCVCVCVRARAHVRKEGGKERENENEEDRESAERKNAENHRESTVQPKIFNFLKKLASSSFPHHSRLLPNEVVSGTFGMALLLLFLLIPRAPYSSASRLSRPEGFLLTPRGSRICRLYQRPARVLFLFLFF